MKKIVLVIISFFLIFLNVKAEGENIVYFNLNSSGSIIINKETFEVKETSKKTTNTIIIQDLTTYQSTFLNSDDTNYPLYILKINGEYKFSNKKEIAQGVYILSTKMYDLNLDNLATDINTCEALFGVQLINFLKNNVFQMLYYIIPIALVVFSSFDFAKLVFSANEKDGISGAFKRFSRRVIAAILIFLTPTILILLTNLIASDEIESCVNTFKTTENINE